MIKLRPFQKEGVNTLVANDGTGLLADEMGLGKTVQFLALTRRYKDSKVLVVCPASVKLHWQREAWRHFKMKAVVISGLKVRDRKAVRRADLVIINYDLLGAWWRFLRDCDFDILGIDECHLLGNPGTLRTRSLASLAASIPRRVGISGTAVTNQVWNLYPTLAVLWPEDFDSPFSFGMTYCEASRSFGRLVFKGGRNLKKLHRKLKRLGMVRRTKAEVLKELPPLVRTVLPVEVDLTEYRKAEEDLIGWLASFDMARASRAARNERRVKFAYYKKLAAQAKMPLVVEWLRNFLEATDEKVLVGVYHRSTTAWLLEEFGDLFVVIDGSKTDRQRRAAEEAFQTDRKVRGMAGQLRAAGLGLNLTAASTVLTVEFGWTAAVHQQFEARPHRLTSKHTVHSVYMVAAGTIEEKLCAIIQKKARTADAILDGVEVRAESLSIDDQLQLAYLKDSKVRRRRCR